MTTPFLIQKDSFQEVWKEAVGLLSANHWNYYNLVVQITDPNILDVDLHDKVTQFAKSINKIPPKDVAYTIFPYGLYKGKGNAQTLYQDYMGRFYPWSRKKIHRGWGTYFERMISYIDKKGTKKVNQLDNIIRAINSRGRVCTAAYTMTITYPGGESIRPLGGPCLNYITVQLVQGNPARLGLMAIYRNHEFLERAYGNYYGLCKLLSFLNAETGTLPGYVTCVSSHAFVIGKKTELQKFMTTI